MKPWLRQRAERAVPPYRQIQSFPRGDPRRWQALETQTARTAIQPLLKPEDAPWLLELWFTDWLRTGLYDPIMATPADLAAHRLHAALNRPEEQEAALWLAFHHKGIPGRLDIMRDIARADTALGRSARRLLRINAPAS